MSTTTLHFRRWVGGPTGHEVDAGIAAFDLDDGHLVWLDAPLLREDLGHRADGTPRTWTVDDIVDRFRPGRTATAYGDAYCIEATVLGLQRISWQANAAADWPDADRVTFAS